MYRFNWGFNDHLQILSVFNLAYMYLFLMICMDKKIFYWSKHQLNSIQHVITDHCLLVWSKEYLPAALLSLLWSFWLLFDFCGFALSNNPWQKKLSHNFSGEVLPNCDLYMYVIVITNCVADFVWVWVLEKVTDKSLLYIKIHFYYGRPSPSFNYIFIVLY